jgi:hypothetical protein
MAVGQNRSGLANNPFRFCAARSVRAKRHEQAANASDTQRSNRLWHVDTQELGVLSARSRLSRHRATVRSSPEERQPIAQCDCARSALQWYRRARPRQGLRAAAAIIASPCVPRTAPGRRTSVAAVLTGLRTRHYAGGSERNPFGVVAHTMRCCDRRRGPLRR